MVIFPPKYLSIVMALLLQLVARLIMQRSKLIAQR